MPKHAPGPWTIDLDSRSDDSHVIVSASGKIVATVHATDIDNDDETQAENLASLAVIAAAPGMLKALRCARHAMSSLASAAGDVPAWNAGGEAYEAACSVRSAIAEAEGKARL